jgi:hypothetical protein
LRGTRTSGDPARLEVVESLRMEPADSGLDGARDDALRLHNGDHLRR